MHLSDHTQNSKLARGIFAALAGASAFFGAGIAAAETLASDEANPYYKEGILKGYAHPWQLGFQDAATPVFAKLHGLHDYLLIVITLITIFVTALLVYVCVKFRASNNPVPSKVTHNTLIEVIWTVVPILILVSIAIPSLRTHYFMTTVENPQMTLKVTGYQWYWGYEYLDGAGKSLATYESRIVPEKDIHPEKGQIRLLSVDNPVVIPVNTTVRVLETGNDVIHSWAVPAFGIKTDAVPGRLNETWFRAEKTGIYYGQCSELCGPFHGFMPIEIHVVDKAVFDQWATNAKDKNYAMDGLQIAAAPAAPAPAATPEAPKPHAANSVTKPVQQASVAPSKMK